MTEELAGGSKELPAGVIVQTIEGWKAKPNGNTYADVVFQTEAQALSYLELCAEFIRRSKKAKRQGASTALVSQAIDSIRGEKQ